MLLYALLFCVSYKSVKQEDEKFDKNKWATKKDADYPYRDRMLNDLITNIKLHGLKKEQVVSLLGEPNRADTFYLFYTIAQKRLGSFPLHTKTLVIKFGKDNMVEWRKIKD